MEELGKQLYNKELMKELRDNVWKKRMLFAFDHHINTLVSFFENVIQVKKRSKCIRKEYKNI
jgi:hypothetical protein